MEAPAESDGTLNRDHRNQSRRRTGPVGSSRARALARRRERLRRRRMVFGGIVLTVLLLVGGIVYGIAGSAKSKEKTGFLEAGITSMEAGNYEAAIVEFEKELELAKGRIGAIEEQTLLYRGEAEYRLGDYAAALHTYETLLEQEPDNADYKKGAALAMIETGDYKGALSLGVINARVYSRMAKNQIETGQYDEALVSVEAGTLALAQEEAVEDHEEIRGELMFHEAVAWEYKSDFKKALELFEEYVRQYGPDEQAEREIVFLKTRQGND